MSTASYFSPVVATLRFLGSFQEYLQTNKKFSKEEPSSSVRIDRRNGNTK